jgi:hypothetical protein
MIKQFSKPILPPLRSYDNYIVSLKAWATTTLFPMSVSTLASAFRRLQDYGITDDMLEVLDIMGAITLAIHHYLQGKPAGLSIGQIARTRIAVERRLLLLPSVEELNPNLVFMPNLYECCRLTAMIFGVAVVFPISNNTSMLQMYVTRLKAAFENMNFTNSSSQDTNISNILLWILVLGGIAALEKPEGPWFVSQLRLLVETLKIDWNGVTEVLETFLWLDSTCGRSGRHLWTRVVYLGL